MSLITIDQLLEYVDLDFEPRWVTKDGKGYIAIWPNTKPETDEDLHKWLGGIHISCPKLKLAEFENKDWQECIYEVPRKVDYTKWVGKVCKFWDGDSKEKHYGILTNIDSSWYPFECNEGIDYEHCEPVRPDDDVIYKGE